MKRLGFFPALLLAMLSTNVSAQDYPAKPIRVVVPFAAGGVSDVIARLISDRLRVRLNQPVLVENRAGGNTVPATEYVLKQSAPDGYTLLVHGASMTVTPHLTQVNYDVKRDVQGVASFVTIPLVMVVNAAVPVKNVAEFVAYAKANPGKLNVGIIGVGVTDHLTSELLSLRANMKVTHIPYKGTAIAITDLLQNAIQVRYDGYSNVKQYVESGRLRILAITQGKRSPVIPDVPTIAESGYPDVDVTSWQGLLARAGTPMGIVTRLSQEVEAIIKDPEVLEKYRTLGFEPRYMNAQQTTEQLLVDDARFGKVVREAGIKVEAM